MWKGQNVLYKNDLRPKITNVQYDANSFLNLLESYSLKIIQPSLMIRGKRIKCFAAKGGFLLHDRLKCNSFTDDPSNTAASFDIFRGWDG